MWIFHERKVGVIYSLMTDLYMMVLIRGCNMLSFRNKVNYP